MKKVIGVMILLAVLLIPGVLALNIEVTHPSAKSAMIIGLDKPAVVDVQIKNKGASQNLEFYTYFTTSMFPKGTTPIGAYETKTVRLEFYPPERIKESGYHTFDYFIHAEDGSESQQTITINAVKLNEALELGSGEVNLDDETIQIYVHNKVTFNFENLTVRFTSPFFDFEETFSLEPNQRKDFVVALERDDFKKLIAGYYTMNAKVETGKLKTEIEAPIKFIEKDILTETKKDYGFIVNTKIITKTNEGNVVSDTQTLIRKNIVSRLFTTFSPEPDLTERQGFNVYYTWNQEINPGESYEIKVRTNWLLPFVLIILLVIIVGITKFYSNRNLVMRKSVSFVRTKGGEFALKVNVYVRAKNYIENINVTERIPAIMKVHTQFGTEKPAKIDEKARKIEWKFSRLQSGETRVLNYILYSKVGVIGKFALPRTNALFERDGKLMERNSNQTFFVIEPTLKKEE